jgi:hypothetical protein
MITDPGQRVRRIWALTVMFSVAAAVLTADAINLADASITGAAVLIAVLALRGVRIDGTSPAHADPIESASAACAPDGDARLADGGECPWRATG